MTSADHSLCRFVWPVAFCAVLSATALSATVLAASPPVVPGTQRILPAESDSTAQQRETAGRVLLTELGCVACHAADGPDRAALKAKPAPVLDAAGARIQRAWLARYLEAPHAVKPGSTMPDLLAGLAPPQRQAEAEALLHLLASTGQAIEAMGDTAAVQRGRKLYHEIGCVACHDPQGPDAVVIPDSVPLGRITEKYTLPTLTAFLRNPLAVRHGGRMPNLRLNDQQARDIACYFFRDVKIATNLEYAYYEGSWNRLPDFDALEPSTTGLASGFDIGVRQRDDAFGLVFRGFLQIRVPGEYRMFLGSDDGSRLVIDGRPLVENDGIHPHSVREARITLKAGAHPVRVDYFEQGGEESLAVEVQGPGLARQPLAALVTLAADPPATDTKTAPWKIDPDLVRQGLSVFLKRGCGSCHQLKQAAPSPAPRADSPRLAELKRLDQGCLSGAPQPGLPFYPLSPVQKQSLQAAIRTAQNRTNDAVVAPRTVIQESLARFNCYACHVRDRTGGVVDARNAHFATTMVEMGDEGRLPPSLDGVGDKLTETCLRDTLGNGSADRPYMLTTMPQFGAANVGHLLDAFRTVDLRTEATVPPAALPQSKMKAIGRQLVGARGLSCIKCHTFGPHRATGIQAIDLQRMSLRLREDWFFRYMDNPQVYRPGTRMPAPWPFGQATVRDVLDGDARQQMLAVWLYLQDGSNAGIPAGLTTGAIMLSADQEPRIYRNFIEGVSPRGIAVAYPEKLNLCFDADELCLALIWENAFIDAAKHWVGRGAGFQRPHGDNVLSLVRGVPLAELSSPDAAWPAGSAKELGFRFLGYRFNDRRQPVFRYSFEDVSVSDAVQPAARRDLLATFTRMLTLRGRQERRIWFRAAAGSAVESVDGAYVIDGRLRLHCSSSASGDPVIRRSGDRTELIVPVDVSSDESSIQLRYEW